MQDLIAIASFLRSLPETPAYRIGTALRLALESLASSPDLSRLEANLEANLGGVLQLRSRMSEQYRIYFYFKSRVPEVVAILHYAQDHTSILQTRLA